MDLQIISYRDSAPIVGLDFTPGSGVTALDITGRDFLDVVDVLVNGVQSPEYLVLSEQKIMARIPDSQIGRYISTVTVLTASVGQTGASVIYFRYNGGRGETSGITYLVQTFLTILLATPGSDMFNPDLGGGLRALVGQVASPSIRVEVSQAITRTTNQILALQASSGLPLEDRLASAELLEVSYDRRTSSVSIRVQIYSGAGRTADAGIRLETEASR